MRQRLNLGDERQTSSCPYCRGELGTKDHVPSKVFIDKPYPENLPVVYCCAKCNQGFSLDEEYVACLIECLKSNSCDLNNFERNSIIKSLQYNDSLLTRIIESSEETEGVLKIKIEEERLLNVLIKLIRGHLLFEFNLPIIDEKISISYFNLNDLTDEERAVFESPIPISMIPEVGCRACFNILVLEAEGHPPIHCFAWNEVQQGRYRYIVANPDSYVVRLVIGEYLACEAYIENC